MSELIDTFANRLSKAISIRNIKPVELSEKTGIDKSKISSYMSGRYKAKQDGIYILSKVLEVDPAWLMGYDVPMGSVSNVTSNVDISSNKKYYMCPVYGRIAAGQPNWAEECIEGRIPLDYEFMGITNPEEYFFLQVNGESMNKVVRNGSYALIHRQDMVENGEIAVVLVNGYEATLKHFSKQGEIIVLTPESSDESIEQQIYTKETPIKVLGKYIGKFEINKNR